MTSLVSEFHFIRPLWLLAIFVVLPVWWMWTRASDPLRGWRSMISKELLDELAVCEESMQSRVRPYILLIGWGIAVIALAGPTWKLEPSPFAEDSAPVLILLKAGESMRLDSPPPSRMERARLKVIDIANEARNQPIGLIAYSGSAHLVMPPTKDTAVIATMAAELSPDIMPKSGDDPAKALELARKTIGQDGGVVLLVTDAIPEDSVESLKEISGASRLVVFVLSVAEAGSVEADAIDAGASAIGGKAVSMTPDATDVEGLLAMTARAGAYVAARGAGDRWAESGYWLVPIVAAIALIGFRREENRSGVSS